MYASHQNQMSAKIQQRGMIPNWKGKVALVVEDDYISYKIIEKYLHPTEIGLLWVKNGEDAFRACENQLPDIALVDIRLPRINGLEFLRWAKQNHQMLPVIIQTAYGLSESRRECHNAGCDGFLAKPFDKGLLIQQMLEVFN